MVRGMLSLGLGLALGALVGAQTMAELRPQQRPATASTPVEATINAPPRSTRPSRRGTVEARPRFGSRLVTALTGQTIGDQDLSRSIRPKVRPKIAVQRIAVASGGGICNRTTIEGARIPAIKGRIAGCGIANPVRITAIGGVRLSQPATLNCETATALDDWVRDGLKPSVGRFGGGATSLNVASHYACRTRNSQPGARLSEHARGNAIDISAIGLANGTDIVLLTDWKKQREGEILRQMWRAACGPFGTVLGPNSNRFHLDHFHFDTASYRSGPYCR